MAADRMSAAFISIARSVAPCMRTSDGRKSAHDARFFSVEKWKIM